MQAGSKQLAHFFENMGGINLTDSTFAIKPSQATGGYNYEYVRTGGIEKSLCPSRINSVASDQLRTLGLFLRNTKDSTKSIIRAAGRKVQVTDLIGTFTNLTRDNTAASTDILAADTEQPVVGSMTTSPNIDVLWLAGGGMDGVYGVPNSTQVTKNGVDAPTGELSLMESGAGGEWATTGTYFYGVAYRKRSTQALSNVALDKSIAVTNVTNSVVVDLTGLTNVDTALYDKIYLVRSAVGGVEGFTTGDLVAIIDSTATSYTDTGASISETENIARAGNTILDNSPLPEGDYNTLTLFKRRLVTASGSTVRLSDLNKFESWPLTNVIEVPSGGAITGLAIISFTTPSATTTDEFLAVFKETELWVITGDTYEDWSLKSVDDKTGCYAQPLIVSANGYLYFIDNRGCYLWDGAGKPVYISRPIEDLFGQNGKIDRSKLSIGFGVFFKRQNQVVWCLSNADLGEQKYLLKLDLRLTLPQVSNTLGQRILDGVFIPGKVNNPAYAGASFSFPTSSNQEDLFITGDDEGYIYRQFYSTAGVGANDYDFTYETKHLDMNLPAVAKNFEKVIVWVENLGDWGLVLDYWTEFRSLDQSKNSVSQVINASTDGTIALWDIAKWGQAMWDNYSSQPKAITFNLNSAPFNNSQGQVLRLRFKNQNSDEPITLYGFSVLWSESGLRL